jgi:hypothetical protein
VIKQTQILWTHFAHGLVTHRGLSRKCPQLSNRTVFTILFIQKLLKEIVTDYDFRFQHIKMKFLLSVSKYKFFKPKHKAHILKIKEKNYDS